MGHLESWFPRGSAPRRLSWCLCPRRVWYWFLSVCCF